MMINVHMGSVYRWYAAMLEAEKNPKLATKDLMAKAGVRLWYGFNGTYREISYCLWQQNNYRFCWFLLSGWLFMVHSPLRITWHISISFWDSFHELANEHAFAGYWCHTNANVFGLSWLVKAVQLELLEILAVKEGRVGGFSLMFQTYLGLDDPQWLISGHARHTRMLATKPTTCMLPLLARTKVTTDGRAKKVSADPKQDDMANYGDVLSLHTVVLRPNSCKTLFRLGPVAEAM